MEMKMNMTMKEQRNFYSSVDWLFWSMIMKIIRRMRERKEDSKRTPDIFADKSHWFRVWIRCDFETQGIMMEEAIERGYEF